MKNICDWSKCKKIGLYRAPVEKDNSRKFRLLCLEHIKIFNKSWNYFADMNEGEIEHFVKSDLTWHKPTKSFSSSENFFRMLWINALDDKSGIFKKVTRFFKKASTTTSLAAFKTHGEFPPLSPALYARAKLRKTRVSAFSKEKTGKHINLLLHI